MAFSDRREAGRALARILAEKRLPNPVVLALPRGGVPVAAEIARVLKAPLDLVLVRKIGVPEQPELAAAAVVDGAEPELVYNDDVMALCGLDRDLIAELAEAELQEIERRRRLYLGTTPRENLEGRAVILVDDGIATGASARAAVKALRRKKIMSLTLAVPVAPQETVEDLRTLVDEVVCLDMPEPFYAIGLHYRDFRQLSDADVIGLLSAARGTDASRRSESGNTS